MSYLCLNAKLILLPTLLHAELLGIQCTILYHDKIQCDFSYARHRTPHQILNFDHLGVNCNSIARVYRSIANLMHISRSIAVHSRVNLYIVNTKPTAIGKHGRGSRSSNYPMIGNHSV